LEAELWEQEILVQEKKHAKKPEETSDKTNYEKKTTKLQNYKTTKLQNYKETTGTTKIEKMRK